MFLRPGQLLLRSLQRRGRSRPSAGWRGHRCLYPSQFSTLNGSASEHDGITSRNPNVRRARLNMQDRQNDGSLYSATNEVTRYLTEEDPWDDEGTIMDTETQDQSNRDNFDDLSQRASNGRNDHIFVRNYVSPASSNVTSEKFQPSNVLRLGGVGSSITENDIRCLVPRKEILPSFRDRFDIVRVSPFRDPKTLMRQPLYQLEFESPEAATQFAERHTAVYNKSPEEWPRHVPFPPGSKPTFVVLDQRSTLLEQRRAVKDRVFLPHAGPGECVLLSVDGPGPAGGGKHRRPPKTEEIWKMLEDKEVKLCDIKSGHRKGRGVEIFETDGAKVITKSGILKKWIVRCFDASEAQRVVREFHMKRPWEPSECMLLAEIID